MRRMSKQLFKVFVYGTLKHGEPNHHWLTKAENGKARFFSNGTTVTKFPLVVGTRYNIPFLLNKPGVGHNIHGEIYEVDRDMFASLDILEDYPKYYDREEQSIRTENNEVVQCWLYLIRNFPEQLLRKPHLEAYHNTKDQLYCESYLNSNQTDLYET